jgi:hypothetical protein
MSFSSALGLLKLMPSARPAIRESIPDMDTILERIPQVKNATSSNFISNQLKIAS